MSAAVIVAAVLAAVYGAMIVLVVVNVVYLRRRRSIAVEPETLPMISVLVPARNEARNLQRLIPSLLEQQYDRFEIVVYDDAPEDDTAAVLASFDDARLRTIPGSGPPSGWVGKVHALYPAPREAKGEVFLITDGESLTRRELVEMICEGMGHAKPQNHVPLAVAKMLLPLVEWLGKVRHKRPILNRFQMKFMTTPLTFNIAKAQRVLGFRPIEAPRESLRKTILWHREHHPEMATQQ